MKIENEYIKFCKHYDDYEEFKDFHENINIRTSSEAICETIGSVMNIQLSNGQYLNPQNLDKEVFCRFNLPPFHTLTNKFIPNLINPIRAGGGSYMTPPSVFLPSF